jgi:hypothetical protein
MRLIYQVLVLLHSNTVALLTIANSGAATFSSSVTAAGQFKTTAAGQSISINAASTDSVRIQLQNNNIGNSIVAVESSAGGSQFTGTTAYSMAIGTATARDLFLGTNSVARMTITSGGNVLIGTSSDDGVKLSINGNAAINDQQFRWRTGGDANHATRFDTDTNGPFTYGYFGAALGYVSDGPQRRVIWTNTTNAYNYNNSTTWQTTSDIRIKENIRPISEALNKICALNPTHFEFKTRLGVTKTGFIAQEFEKVFPNHVTEIEPNGEFAEYFAKGEKIKSIDADLIPYLVKAIQELKAEIDQLKNK